MHSMRGLEFSDMITGMIFGVFEQIRSICVDPLVKSNRVCIFFDSKQSYRRRAYPDYKAHRRKAATDDEIARLDVMHQMSDLLRTEILDAIGMPTYRQTGLESDDLIAKAAKSLEEVWSDDKQCVIIAADSDLYQCISKHTHWYDPGRAKYYDDLKFWASFEIDASLWGRVKAIAGCSTDNVKGVKGVGQQTAIAYLVGNLPSSRKRYIDITCANGRMIEKRNSALVVLPHAKTKPIELKEPHYNPDAFWQMCKRFGFQSYLEGAAHREWERIFSGAAIRTGIPPARYRGKRGSL